MTKTSYKKLLKHGNTITSFICRWLISFGTPVPAKIYRKKYSKFKEHSFSAFVRWRPVWPDLAKFRRFGKSLHTFGKILTVYFLFGKMLSLLRQICDIIGLIFIVANGQILKNNLTTWSHCWRHTHGRERHHMSTTTILGSKKGKVISISISLWIVNKTGSSKIDVHICCCFASSEKWSLSLQPWP